MDKINFEIVSESRNLTFRIALNKNTIKRLYFILQNFYNIFEFSLLQSF